MSFVIVLSRGLGFEPSQRHSVVFVLEQSTLSLLLGTVYLRRICVTMAILVDLNDKQ